MKKYIHIAILAMMMTIGAGLASADSVDIGLGEMDRAEFDALKQLVSGQIQPSASAATEKPADVYVAEFYWKDIEGVKQSMAFGGSGSNEAVATGNGHVDIGLGAMSTNEFCDLNKLVASNTVNTKKGFAFVCP